MDKSERLVEKRAKEIFERDKRADKAWGGPFQERESSTASPILDMVDDVRARNYKTKAQFDAPRTKR